MSPDAIVIRNIQPSDASLWAKLRCDLWPDGAGDHPGEIAAFLAGTVTEPQAVLVAQHGSVVVGFAELSLREDIASLRGKRVGYAEGLYVVPPSRGSGVARMLLQAARVWAKNNACEGFASDRAGRVVIDPNF
jgi:aminoglycoside 6'-N-acetyltransferase I